MIENYTLIICAFILGLCIKEILTGHKETDREKFYKEAYESASAKYWELHSRIIEERFELIEAMMKRYPPEKKIEPKTSDVEKQKAK